jgi:hypothetical protein
MNAQYLRLVLANGEETRLTESLTGGQLYVKTENGDFVQVTCARAIIGIKAERKSCIRPDGTMVEYDARDNIERIVPPSEPWLKTGDMPDS